MLFRSAVGSETLDDAAADALIAAGDCSYFAFETIGHLGLPCGHFSVQKVRCGVRRFVSSEIRGAEGVEGRASACFGRADGG